MIKHQLEEQLDKLLQVGKSLNPVEAEKNELHIRVSAVGTN
jgi:hypothetical protein